MSKAVRVVLILAIPLLDARLLACGDKFLLASRGARGMKIAAHPADVLIYLGSSSAIGDTDRQRLQSFLKVSGHRPARVDAAEQLGAALRARRYDVVLVDSADADAVARAIRAASASASVVPVSTSTKPAELLATLESLMKERASAKPGK